MGGLGLALPAGHCNLIKPTIFFAIMALLRVGSGGLRIYAALPVKNNYIAAKAMTLILD
jgi:hypothetical protein